MVSAKSEAPSLHSIRRHEGNTSDFIFIDRQMIKQLSREIQEMQHALQDQNARNEQLHGEPAFLHTWASQELVINHLLWCRLVWKKLFKPI